MRNRPQKISSHFFVDTLCPLSCDVIVLVIAVITSMITAEIIFSGMLKLKAKYGKANAKLSTRTLNSEAMIPYTKPSVILDTKNTAIAITAGGTVSAENFVSNKRHSKNAPAKILIIFNPSIMYFVAFFIFSISSVFYYTDMVVKNQQRNFTYSFYLEKKIRVSPAGPLALRRTHVAVHEGKLRPLRTDGVLNPAWKTLISFSN